MTNKHSINSQTIQKGGFSSCFMLRRRLIELLDALKVVDGRLENSSMVVEDVVVEVQRAARSSHLWALENKREGWFAGEFL